MKKILIIITLLCFGLLCHANNELNNQSTMTVNRINLHVDSMLNKVVNDAYRRMSKDSVPGYYSVLMNEYKGGTLVKAVKTQTDVYELRDNWQGYAEVDENKEVIDFGLSRFRLEFITPAAALTVKLERFVDNPHVGDIKYYYILDDIIAIYSPESGWIWSDGKPDQ